MGVKVVSNVFTDIFGNDLGFYQANAGDKVTLTTIVETNLRITEIAGVTVNIDWVNDEFQLIGGLGWLGEGFRLGDSVNMEIWEKATDTLTSTRTYTTDYVSSDILRIAGAIGGIFDHNLYTLIFIVNSRQHSDIEMNINHCLNSNGAVLGSLIDGELTTVKFSNVNGLSVAGAVTGSLIGNQSGGYLISSVATRLSDLHNSRRYSIVSIFIQSGVYDSANFELGEALKIAYKFKVYSLPDEIANITELAFSEIGNTGWFNEAFNVGVVDSVLTSGLATLDYAVATTSNIVVDSASTVLYLGAQYVSTDSDRFKNKVQNQNSLSLLLNAYVPLAVGTYTSAGGLYTITVNSIGTVGTVKTINITFTPLAGFSSLFDSFDVGDRLFYIWLKSGNVNHLVFNGQMVKTAENILPLITKGGFLRHDKNNQLFSDITFPIEKTNTEDNLALISRFTIAPYSIFSGLNIQIVGYNSVTAQEFELEKLLFSFSAIQINSSGQYLIDVSLPISNNLPSTSAKKIATLKLNLVTNSCELYFPWVNNWKYWLSQNNAVADFYPNQNKNWINYVTGDWSVKIKLTLSSAAVDYVDYYNVPISDYDTEPFITSTIELFRESDVLLATPTTSMFEGEIMTVRATHSYVGWTALSSWGEITQEPFESQPRELSSTVILTDGSSTNALTSTVATNTPSLTVLICKLDVDKLNNSKFKFTSKIFLSVVEAEGMVFQEESAVNDQDTNYLDTQN